MKKIPVLTKNELNEFLSTQKTISELREKVSPIQDKMDQILIDLLEEWHVLNGSRYSEDLWVDEVEYLNEIHFCSNWGMVYGIKPDDLLDPKGFLEQFRKSLEEEEKKKTAKFLKRKEKQAQKKLENEKLKSLGFDTKNMEKLKRQVLKLYDESA